ncbi:MAG: anthranilate phosphoribosyltransferase [Candidatus Schekmanbacteria bacterium]|nr:anthranilate phosphoribosyltransferase [Candidatus Schekmanbacteria bacterium]
MIKESLAKLVERKDLTGQDAAAAMGEIMNGEATFAQIAAFITALRMKGETVEEISACAQVMREKALKVPVQAPGIIDTCGTGGDGTHTFNISTATALVAAAVGVPVAKHGNRSVSSQCGSADVLKELGVCLEISPEKMGACIDQVGIGFLFAPLLHPAMKHAIGPRRELGIRTVFNILGPLTNPAGAKRQLMGVYSPHLIKPLAEVLGKLGSTRALVVHGHGGLDELSLSGANQVAEYHNGTVTTYTLSPADFTLSAAPIETLSGGTPQENAQIIRLILDGENSPRRDVVLMNAAAALVIAGKADNWREGVYLAKKAIDSGAAAKVLQRLAEFSNS